MHYFSWRFALGIGLRGHFLNNDFHSTIFLPAIRIVRTIGVGIGSDGISSAESLCDKTGCFQIPFRPEPSLNGRGAALRKALVVGIGTLPICISIDAYFAFSFFPDNSRGLRKSLLRFWQKDSFIEIEKNVGGQVNPDRKSTRLNS